MSVFCEGLSVKYNEFYGEIRFVSSSYVTICIRHGEHKVNDVCILVFRDEWQKIHLIKESEK